MKYQCLSCGAVGNSARCPACGNDAEPMDDALPETESGGTYTIFDHTQGIRTTREVSQEKQRPTPRGMSQGDQA